MTAEAIETAPPLRRPSPGLRMVLASGPCAIPLDRIHVLIGYATLTGEPDDYFLGWLNFRGEPVPVFDLNRIVCDMPTLPLLGARILLLHTPPKTPTPLLGLLAGGVTDTVPPNSPDAPTLDLNLYLPMLYTLIPDVPQPDTPQPDPPRS